MAGASPTSSAHRTLSLARERAPMAANVIPIAGQTENDLARMRYHAPIAATKPAATTLALASTPIYPSRRTFAAVSAANAVITAR